MVRCSVLQYGVYISNYMLNGDPRNFVNLAKEAEECNWDGFFMWDHINPETGFKKGVADPWIAQEARRHLPD